MLCDVCKMNDAAVFLTQIVDGKMQKVNLCEGCSKEKGVTDPTGFALADLLLGLGAAQWDYGPSDASVEELAARPTTWVVVGRPEDTARFTGSGWSEPTEGPVLTDDFSDIVRLLRFR